MEAANTWEREDIPSCVWVFHSFMWMWWNKFVLASSKEATHLCAFYLHICIAFLLASCSLVIRFSTLETPEDLPFGWLYEYLMIKTWLCFCSCGESEGNLSSKCYIPSWPFFDVLWCGRQMYTSIKLLNISNYPCSSFGERNGNPLQYSCLENPMYGGAWEAAVHGVMKSWTRLSDFTSLVLCDRIRRQNGPSVQSSFTVWKKTYIQSRFSVFRNEVLLGQALFNIETLRIYIQNAFPLHGLKESNIKDWKKNSNRIFKTIKLQNVNIWTPKKENISFNEC